MIPQNASHQQTVVRSILWLLCVFAVALAAIINGRTENVHATPGLNLGMTKGYCASYPGDPVVYFSNIFDAVTKGRNKISTSPLNNAFHSYLIEQYDYKTRSSIPATCRVFETLGQAEASRRQFVTEAQQANKQFVEVNWNPGPLTEVQQNDTVILGLATPPPTHTFCAVGHETTMYFSAVFDSDGALPNPKWNDAFSEFLSKQYGFRPEVEATCTILSTIREAEYNLKARIGNVRYNRHKAVETGWKFDPTGTYKPAPKPTPKADDDPEPPKRPAPPTATQTTRDAAVKEMPESTAFCKKDPLMSVVFNCDSFARSVHNYRVEHPTDTDTLARLAASGKLNAYVSIDSTHVSLWVMDRATAQKLGNRVTGCVTQNVIVTLYKKPQADQLPTFYKDAVTTCGKVQ